MEVGAALVVVVVVFIVVVDFTVVEDGEEGFGVELATEDQERVVVEVRGGCALGFQMYLGFLTLKIGRERKEKRDR